MTFSLNGVKEKAGKSLYPSEIVTENELTSAEYISENDALDLTFENNDYKYRERFFNPTSKVPEWTTAEKETQKTQRRLMHILRRFMTQDEAQSLGGETWKEFCENVASNLMEKASGKTFDLKFVFDKKFEYPELGSFPFIRVEGEKELFYTDWEKKNRLLQVATTGSDAISNEDIF